MLIYVSACVCVCMCLLQCIVAGLPGLRGGSAWGRVGSRVCSGPSAVLTTPAAMATGGSAEEYTGRHGGKANILYSTHITLPTWCVCVSVCECFVLCSLLYVQVSVRTRVYLVVCLCFLTCVCVSVYICVDMSVFRCQTEPCLECEHQGHSYVVGERWRAGQCLMCQCLANLTTHCAPYCPHAITGCPQVRMFLHYITLNGHFYAKRLILF